MSLTSHRPFSPRSLQFVFRVLLVALLAGRSLPSPSYGFTEPFDTTGSLQEAGSISASASPSWWVSSGAYLLDQSGLGMTVQGSLPADDPWRTAYASSNPVDTDDGYHPQNLFRLVARGFWKNFTQQAYFRIQAHHASASPNRNASNGLFFFNRYLDANNVYYTGIRVDGAAVIKKKMNGTYYTMASRKIFSGTYDATSSPILLPVGSWIGMRTVTSDNGAGGVDIRVEVDHPSLGSGWTAVLSATDSGGSFGGSAIAGPGHAGLRTDFMDVEFENYSAVEACSPTVTPTSSSFGAAGGSASLSVSVESGCSWSATSSSPWATITAGATGSGSGTVAYTVAANDTGGTRTATLSVGGQAVTVTQTGAACSFVISPSEAAFGGGGGLGSTAVSAPAGCAWKATSPAKWVTIGSGTSGTGGGTVAYSVAKNTSRKSRSAALSIAGQTFTVTQASR